MKEIYGIIYKIENKINHKVYIGQTIYDFSRRYGKDFAQVKNEYLRADIEKYGVDNFEVTKVLDKAYSKEELDELEIKYIAEYESTNREKGYNISTGGHNSLHSEETKEKIRQANIGEKNPMFGLRGKNNPKYSRVSFKCHYCGNETTEYYSRRNRSKYHYCSTECRYKDMKNVIIHEDNRVIAICSNCKQQFKRFPSQLKDKKYLFCTRKCQKEFYKELNKGENNPNYGNHKVCGGNNGRAKKVICLETQKIYECAKDADREYNFRFGSVSSVCRGDQKSTHGLHFKFY